MLTTPYFSHTYRTLVALLGLRTEFRYDVVVEGYALNSEFNFPSLDLYPSFPTATDECFIQFVQFVERIRPCRDVVTINSKSMAKGFRVSFTVKQAITL